MKKNQKTFISLFSGAGGLDIGFEEAGFKCTLATDIELFSKKTFEKNFPNIPFIHDDIRNLSAEKILSKNGNIYPDVILGGPPCQGFSVMGDKSSSDIRNLLFLSYVNLVDSLKPQCFIFENVKGFKTMYSGRFFEEVSSAFASIGYNIHYKTINSSDHGVPQNRQRVFLFGTCLDNHFSFPKNDYNDFGDLKAFKNVGQAINDLAGKENVFPNHLPLNHTETVIKRYELIPEGGQLPSPESLPKEIRRKNFGNTYNRLHRKKSAPTMVPGNNAFPVHPTLNRSLTPREAARIQTFPDKIVFEGNRREQCILVGNAVPPLLAAKIAKNVNLHLNLKTNKSPDLLISKYETFKKNKRGDDKLTFVDLFCGAGGITKGFLNADFKAVFCADNMPEAINTHKENFPEIPMIESDLNSLEAKNLAKNFSKKTKVDILVGGPPCQGFSMYGKRRFVNTKEYNSLRDERNDLVFTFIDYAKILNPNWIIMENVPGIVSLANGFYLNSLIKKIKKIGYKNVEYRIINTADYGVPQERKRFILIANKNNLLIPWPKPKFFKNPKPWQNAYVGINSYIGDIVNNTSLANHKPMNHSKNTIERFSFIKEGKKLDIDSLPDKLKFSRSGKKIRNYSNIFKRLERNKPSCTLVPGHSAFPIHPTQNRQLTVREAARIQTFPDDIIFLGNQSKQCTLVGNAFPVKAAEYLGNTIRKCITNEWSYDSLNKLSVYSYLDINNSIKDSYVST